MTARTMNHTPAREVRRTKNVHQRRWVKKKVEVRDREETQKFVEVTTVNKPCVPTRCCTKCGFSDLDCSC